MRSSRYSSHAEPQHAGADGHSTASASDASAPTSYKVYPTRWIVLGHMSLLNLLSDWTCFSVAPLSTLTNDAYGRNVNPENLVTVFLIANALGTALEPSVLGRLGLRNTVVLGSFLLALGSIVKSGGYPILPSASSSWPLTMWDLHEGWPVVRMHLGFFCVGLSQPLYQCTPALLSASWFPESERTTATSVALNANQLGIGFAFLFGSLLVRDEDDISPYFGWLSVMSTISFVGCAMHLEDAPPTPPSGTARVMRGTVEVSVRDLLERAGSLGVATCGAAAGAAAVVACDRDNSGAAEASEVDFSVVGTGINVHGSGHADDDTQFSNLVRPAPYATSDFTSYDDGIEPVLTQTPHHLSVAVRDDQFLRAAKECLSRPGFPHALTAFAVSGCVVNTLSTYMDYLVRLDGSSGRIAVGTVGATFQVLTVVSSLMVSRVADRTKAFYCVVLSLLVLGAFALAECGVSLDADRGTELRYCLLVVACLAGPIAGVATELGVDVAYPLCENTVLVVQQLFMNVLSAAFIPLFQWVKDVGVDGDEYYYVDDDGGNGGNNNSNNGAEGGGGRPPYTFSFYLLIVLHAVATVHFAAFNGRYLRMEAESAKATGKKAGGAEGKDGGGGGLAAEGRDNGGSNRAGGATPSGLWRRASRPGYEPLV